MNNDLIRAFANTIEAYSELHSKCWGATPEECKELMTMKFPLIQGMVMQNAIRRIGKMLYNPQKAAEQIVAYSNLGTSFLIYVICISLKLENLLLKILFYMKGVSRHALQMNMLNGSKNYLKVP